MTENENSNSSTSAEKSKDAGVHPLSSLSAQEIALTAVIVKRLWPPSADLHFKIITLQEPRKDELLPYLEAGHGSGKVPLIERKVWVNYYVRNTVSINILSAMNRCSDSFCVEQVP
jgi:primary-amine oxidase